MDRLCLLRKGQPRNLRVAATLSSRIARLGVLCCAFLTITATAQVITIDTSGKGPVVANAPVDRRYQQIQPTSVPLSATPLSGRARIELMRVLQSDQGFAMRPLPRGHKGLTLAANGKLSPAGESYLNMVIAAGLSAKPGDRVVLTDVKIEHDQIVLQINGGPDWKHRFLRHISVGPGPDMTSPVVRSNDGEPTGSRITLTFHGQVPELTPAQVKALLAPLISFDVKTPIQAFTDTLPTPLKEAILGHQVLVGMTTDMVLFAKGQPQKKLHEMDGQMPIDIWIYGKPPETVDFVRINGNRVIRLEVCATGKPTVVYDRDVVEGMMRTDGTPVLQAQNVRVVKEGDVQRDPDKEAPAPPPSLRKPGETLPTDDQRVGVMRPVRFPRQEPEPQIGANPDDQQPASPDATAQQPGAQADPAPASGAPASSQPDAGQSK